MKQNRSKVFFKSNGLHYALTSRAKAKLMTGDEGKRG
jgi:hypothetical protein